MPPIAIGHRSPRGRGPATAGATDAALWARRAQRSFTVCAPRAATLLVGSEALGLFWAMRYPLRMAVPVFKILSATQWADRTEVIPYAPVDIDDGYMHLSTASQVRQTAEKHFRALPNLVLLRIDPDALSDLRWERSRGGERFPHAYGPVSVKSVLEARTLRGAAESPFVWPADVE